MKRSRTKWREHRPHAQVHWPWMDSREALRVIELFEQAIRAIWRAHGDAIADYLACVDPDSPRMQMPPDAVWSGQAKAPDTEMDEDLDF